MDENTEVVEQLDVTPEVEQTENPSIENTEPAVAETGTEDPLDTRSAAEAAFDKLAGKTQKKELTPLSEQKTEVKPTEPVKGLDPQGRGPNSWKADVREEFKTLSPKVQAEVLRRENEHQKLMNETTELRRFGDTFMQTIQPYQALLHSKNIHPLDAVKGLMNDAYTLETGSPQTKAQWVSSIIKQHNIDLDILNDVLSNTLKPVDPVLQELNQLKAKMAERETYERNTVSSHVDQTIEQFANDPANEFFGDVVSKMQVLLANNEAVDLQDAYDQACNANKDIRAVLQQRAAQAAPQEQSQATVQQKIAASSSVKGAPTTTRPTTPKPKLSGREATEAAWEALEKKMRA